MLDENAEKLFKITRPVLFVFFRTKQSKKHKNHTETTSLPARRFLSHFVEEISLSASWKAPLSVIEKKIEIITR